MTEALSAATLRYQPRVLAPPPGPGLCAAFAFRGEQGQTQLLEISLEALQRRDDELGQCLREAWERFQKNTFTIPARRHALALGPAPTIVGVVNATPDSFFAGSRSDDARAAVERGLRMLDAGASWLDIGGESTRPGAASVPAEEEKRRVLPVIEGIRKRSAAPLSIDTRKAEVADAALECGADIVNDVSALQHDPDMAEIVAQRGAPVVLNHMRGTPQTMQTNPCYEDPVAEVYEELLQSIERCLRAGIPCSRILLDPGIGFGKRPQDNLAILRRLAELRSLGLPLFVGVSRKSFLGKLLDERPAEGRLWGSAAALAAAVAGGAKCLRVHDPAEMADVARIAAAIAEG